MLNSNIKNTKFTYKSKTIGKKTRKNIKKTKKNSKSNDMSNEKKKNETTEFINSFYENSNSSSIIKNLINFYNLNYDDAKFKKYKDQFNSFDKSNQGRSGGIVGTLNNYPDKILKIHTISNHKVSDLIRCRYNNANINFKFNEIIINYVLSNLKYIQDFEKDDLKYVNKFLIKMYDFGFSKNAIYFVNDKVGIEHLNFNNKKIYITNLSQLMDSNHIPLINKAIRENNSEVLRLYDLLLTIKFKEYMKAVSILQNKIDYLNSDSKLNNIFIKQIKNTDSKFDVLKDYGFVIDFRLLISDLDKSSIVINKTKIFPIFEKPEILKFIGIKFLGLVNLEIRHQIEKNLIYKNNVYCNLINYNTYDLMCCIVNLFIILYKNTNKSIDINNYLVNFNNLIKTELNIDDIKYNNLHNVIKKRAPLYEGKHTSYFIIQTLNKFCLNKKI
jgi:hypothetical protein